MIDPSKVYALLPTLHRPAGLMRAVQSLRETAPLVKIVVATDPDDIYSRLAATELRCQVTICENDRMGNHAAWNQALSVCPPDAQAFLLMADDAIARPGWLDLALQALDEMGDSGLIGFNDDKPGRNGGEKPAHVFWATHYMMTRDFLIQHNGGVMAIPVYYCDNTDAESCMRAIRANKYRYLPNAHISHIWLGHAKDADETYTKGNPHRAESHRLYKERLALGFPDNFKPIVTE